MPQHWKVHLSKNKIICGDCTVSFPGLKVQNVKPLIEDALNQKDKALDVLNTYFQNDDVDVALQDVKYVTKDKKNQRFRLNLKVPRRLIAKSNIPVKRYDKRSVCFYSANVSFNKAAPGELLLKICRNFAIVFMNEMISSSFNEKKKVVIISDI